MDFLNNAFPPGGAPPMPGAPPGGPGAGGPPNMAALMAMLQRGGPGPGLQPPPPGAAAAAGTAPSPALGASAVSPTLAAANDPMAQLLQLLKAFLPPPGLTAGLEGGGGGTPAGMLPGGMRRP